MARIVAAIFDNVTNAEQAYRALLNADLADDEIGVVVRDADRGRQIAGDLGRTYAGAERTPTDMTSPTEVYADLPERFLRVTRHGNLPPEALDWYRSRLDAGNVMIIVDAGESPTSVIRILRDHQGMGYPVRPQPAAATPPATPETVAPFPHEAIHVPVIDEQVVVEKRAHQVGEVVVSAEKHEEARDIPVTVSHEEVHVERRELEHPMRPEEYQGRVVEEGVVHIPIMEEEVVVEKVPVVREEIIVTRTRRPEETVLHEEVMHTEPTLEPTGRAEEMVPEETVLEEEFRRRPAA